MGFYSDFAEYYEAVFPFREEVYAFVRRRLPPGARRVLDIGCGTGHYCGRLAADGFEAVGIDLDPKMIEVATARYPAATFHQLDMRDVSRLPRGVQAAFCIGNTLSHLPHADYPRLLGSLADTLTPGAAWIFQVMNWDYILDRGSYTFKPRGLADEVVFERAYRDLSEAQVRFVTRLLVRGREVFAGEARLYPVRSQTYQRLHRAAGFDAIEHLGDFSGIPFAADADSGNVFVFRRREGGQG
jgi:SAM-dependent methyltransferase